MKTQLLASALLGLLADVYAARLPMQKRASPGVPMRSKGSAAVSAQGTAGAVAVTDIQDTAYSVDITLGGQNFSVLLDTGSSDLWVFPNQTAVKLTNTTTIPGSLAYGIGNASGTIDFAEVTFGSYTIPSQAFLNVNVTNDMDAIFSSGASGILGMSFTDAESSSITAHFQKEFGNTTLGDAVISNIFAQNPGAPNCFDILLARVNDLEEHDAGVFLIGEHLDGYETVESQPKLYKQWPDRWTVTADGMTVNGEPFEFGPSSVPDIPAGKIGAVLDTGFSFPPFPPAAVDAIYSSIPGAINITDLDIPAQWLVPCTAVTNLTFTFGGIEFPVHPLDLTTVKIVALPIGPNGTNINTTICLNTYQYTILSGPGFTGFDLILGEAFIRNIYASFNMGDATGANSNSFVQLLSRTTFDDAIPDFAASRSALLSSMPTALDPSVLVPALRLAVANDDGDDDSDDSTTSQTSQSPAPSSSSTSSGSSGSLFSKTGAGALADDTSSSTSNGQLTSLVTKYGPVVLGLLAANVVFGLLLCIIGLVVCLRVIMKTGVTSSTRSVGKRYTPVRSKEQETMAHPERESFVSDETYTGGY